MMEPGMNGRRDAVNGWRWVAVLLALVLALGATVALTDGASAARSHKHKTHHTTPTPAFPLDFTCAQAWNTVLGVVCVKTQAGAALTIRITTCGHVVNDAGLQGTAKADDKGQFVWNWTPNTTCKTGQARVTASVGGKSVTKTTTFTIDAAPGV